jgi:hypothetical protein
MRNVRAYFEGIVNKSELLCEIRAWFRRWIRVRELTHRSLVEIFEDLNRFDAIEHHKIEPSSKDFDESTSFTAPESADRAKLHR